MPATARQAIATIQFVRLSRPEWSSPLTLSFEGLTERLGGSAACDVWDVLAAQGEHVDSAGTRYEVAS